MSGFKSDIPAQDACDQHFDRIHRAALVLSGNPWDADDLAQETFLVYTRQQHLFRGSSSLYTYLYGILLNLDRRERRRQGVKRRKLLVLWDDRPECPPSTPGSDAVAETAEWRNSLWARVADLPDAQRHALVLRFSEGLAYEEIAVAMDCPLGTVKSRIYHGLLGLRQRLESEGEDACRLPDFPAEGQAHAV